MTGLTGAYELLWVKERHTSVPILCRITLQMRLVTHKLLVVTTYSILVGSEVEIATFKGMLECESCRNA